MKARGSLYTLGGQERRSRSLPSVKTWVNEQIPRGGAPHLGFEAWNEERVRCKHRIGWEAFLKGRTKGFRRTHLLRIASGYSLGWVGVNIQLDGAQMREGVSSFWEEVRSRVRFLGWVRVLLGLGGRSTCVECIFTFLCKIWGIWLVGGSFFPLGQSLERWKSE